MISFASRVTQGAFSGDTERLDGTSDYLRIWISIGHFEFRACFIQTQMHLRLASLIPRQVEQAARNAAIAETFV
jgi:hypothetical protein